MQTHELNSVHEFMNVLERLIFQFSHTVNKMDFSYRGLSDNSYYLQPAIFREIELDDYSISGRHMAYLSSEYEILSHFIKEASSYITGLASDNYLLWIEYAQHYGVPTRLLDFTSNPLVALYFSCRNKPKTDGSIWVLNEINFRRWCYQSEFVVQNSPITKNQIITQIVNEIKVSSSLDNNHQKIEMERPVSYIPYYIDQRMITQSSRFLIWGTDTRAIEEMVSEKEYMVLSSNGVRVDKANDTRFLFQFIIPSNRKRHILKQLNILGINEKTLFPGLDGIGKHIAHIYRTNAEDLFGMLL